eukprot:CAMPEP_0118852072 /NCGR_PEP_ID=MMETSP1163-20130328/1248_1 /TAXON_ID=124430 /ORGANISM="Phaeomonas parva, Strain CCMP2877" /LENGTH=381 /DNA_ID=CAMNT_0006784473 /DNA_START=36 /DNA_END=1181 /DNA_ORIENTATION=+
MGPRAWALLLLATPGATALRFPRSNLNPNPNPRPSLKPDPHAINPKQALAPLLLSLTLAHPLAATPAYAAAATPPPIEDDAGEAKAIRVAQDLYATKSWADLRGQAERLVEFDPENPQPLRLLGEARLALGDFAAASDDLSASAKRFRAVGDKIPAAESEGLAFLAALGDGATPKAAAAKLDGFSRNAKGIATNNPADLPLLQDLARREAEAHLALAGAYYSEGKTPKAAEEWLRGCIRLEGCEVDAAQRRAARQAQLNEETRRMTSPQGADVGDAAEYVLARITGMDPSSAYITRRESDGRLWEQFKPGKAKIFDPKTALPDNLSEFQGCRRVREGNFPSDWPENVSSKVKAFVRDFDFAQIEKVKTTRQLGVSWDELVD